MKKLMLALAAIAAVLGAKAAKTDSNHDPTDDRQKPPNTPPMTRAA